MMPRAGVLLAVVVAVFAERGTGAQRPAQPTPPPVFHSGISYVELDASVLDRNRNPVRGLTAGDFTVLENGQPQKILSFTEIDVPDPEPPPVAWMRDVTPDVRANDEALDRRVVVILLDDGQIRVDRTQWDRTQNVAKMLIDRLGPSDLAAVLFTRIQKSSQDFTNDHAKLQAAIDAFTPGAERPDAASNAFGFDIPGGGGGAMNGYFGSLAVEQMSAIANYLSALPGRRKALFFVSVGIPDCMLNPGPRLVDMFRDASRANVNIYPIDPSGLGGVDDVGVAGSSAAGSGSNRGIDCRQEYLRGVAENTGGYAITNRNDFDTSVPKILGENGSYYLLGYESPDLKTDGKFRKIEVKVDRPGVTVRARSGYYGARPDVAKKAPSKPNALPPALETAAGALIPSAEVRMQVSAAPFALSEKPGAAVTITLGLRPEAFANTSLVDEVEFFAGAFKVDGTLVASTRQPFQIGTGFSQYELQTRLDLKPGRYQLRVSAHSKLHDKAGSVFTDLDVPDFSKEPLSLSGIVVHAEPGLPGPALRGAAALAPLAPTTLREFSRDQTITALLRVYQGGKAKLAPVALSAQIRDIHDVIVGHVEETLDPAQFDKSRSAAFREDLGLGQLAPGPYLLTIEAMMGTARPVRRDVRFVVREGG